MYTFTPTVHEIQEQWRAQSCENIFGTYVHVLQTGLWYTLAYILSLPPILHPKVLVGFLNIQSEEQDALLCQRRKRNVVCFNLSY